MRGEVSNWVGTPVSTTLDWGKGRLGLGLSVVISKCREKGWVGGSWYSSFYVSCREELDSLERNRK